MASRLDFDLDPLVSEAIAEYRGLIAESSPARLLEEYYKILRSGYAEATFRGLAKARLLELITPELKNPSDALWDSLDRLDTYRRRFPSAPPELTNTVLIGSLLVPTGALDRRSPPSTRDPHGDRLNFGILQIARRDMERLRYIRQMTPRMADPDLPPRVARGIVGRPAFPDALVWLELFQDEPERVEFWRQQRTMHAAATGEPGENGVPADALPAGQPRRRRRRRRRRGGNRMRPEGDG
jgi:poly(A) polymerase